MTKVLLSSAKYLLAHKGTGRGALGHIFVTQPLGTMRPISRDRYTFYFVYNDVPFSFVNLRNAIFSEAKNWKKKTRKKERAIEY